MGFMSVRFFMILIAAFIGMAVVVLSVFLQWDGVPWWVHLAEGVISAVVIYFDLLIINQSIKGNWWRRKDV